MRVMVIGASPDQRKFGNKALRAYLRRGHQAVAINPSFAGEEVEGVPCYASAADPDGPFDRALLYIPPQRCMPVIRALGQRKDVGEVWFNPGTESPELFEEAERLGLETVRGCAIVDIGANPYAL